jgi:hypothetical protein
VAGGEQVVSERIMQRLAGAGRTGVFLAVIVVTLVGLFLPSWLGALLIALLVAGLATLMTRTWIVTSPRNRMIRVLVLIALTVIALGKIVH